MDFNELARDARRALEGDRECLTDMARNVEGYSRLLDAANDLAAENESMKDQLEEKDERISKLETQLNEMGKLVAGVAKKSTEDNVVKFIRVFVNKSKKKTAKKRALIKEMLLEFTYANDIDLPGDLRATIYALDDEQPEPKIVINKAEDVIAEGGVKIVRTGTDD